MIEHILDIYLESFYHDMFLLILQRRREELREMASRPFAAVSICCNDRVRKRQKVSPHLSGTPNLNECTFAMCI